MSRFDLGEVDDLGGLLDRPDPTNSGLDTEPKPIVKDSSPTGDLKAQEAAIAAQLTQAQDKIKHLEEESGVGKLMSIPGVRQAIEAYNRGESYAPPAAAPKPAAEDEAPNWEALSENPQLLEQHILKSVASTVDKLMGEKLRPVTDSITGLQAYAQKQEMLGVKQQIDKARKDFSDFKQYEPAMLGISREAPGLSVNELYLLAKVRAGVPLTPPQGGESERPTRSLPTRPPRLPDRREGPVTPLEKHQDFALALKAAADRGVRRAFEDGGNLGEAE